MIRSSFFSTFAVFFLFGIASAADTPESPSASAVEKADGENPEAEKHLLRYQLQMGEVLRYRIKHSANISTTIEGTSQQAESISQSVKAIKVTDVLPNGEMECVLVVESVRMSNRVPNRALTKYDSEKDKTPPPGFEQAARAVGVALSVIRLTPCGVIAHRKEKHPQPKYSEDMPITLQLPEKAVAVGEKWDATYEIQVNRNGGNKQQVRTRRLCKLKAVQQGVATIHVVYQILTPVDAFVESQLVERMTEGIVRFDIDAGRILSQQHEVDHHVLGFSGATSSMHCTSRLEERLLPPGEKLARKKAK